MYKIGAVGEKDEIYAFLALGIDILAADSPEEAMKAVDSMAREGYGLIFVTETLAKDIDETIERYKNKLLPGIILIPGKDGSLKIALNKVRENVEKAVGIDILSKKEG